MTTNREDKESDWVFYILIVISLTISGFLLNNYETIKINNETVCIKTVDSKHKTESNKSCK